ncbi:O-antigen ligase family protein [Janthinobacterium sp.]|uniref:O-antigen ligase family protein n=1 Tax=Janthinobacterium sp. TaxID=1871054 RepID=UPI00293D5C05|nr:O-antigen ligase family protein [Janthinobacterium sp.]
MTRFTSFAVCLFSALALIVAGGYSLGAALLLLGSTFLLWQRPRLGLNHEDHLLIAVFLAYFVVYAANAAFHADHLREYDAPLRFLLAIPVLLLLLAHPPRASALWGGLAIGAIGAGVFVSWQSLMLGVERPGGTTNPIQFGNISMLMGILCLCGLVWARAQAHRAAWTGFMLLGGLFGILGSQLSASRGGWIALPVCVCVLAIHAARVHGKRYLYGGLLALAALVTVSYEIPHSPLKTRTEMAVREVQSFTDTGNIDTSSGLRIEMWRSAIAMFPQHPWLGWGQQGYMDYKVVLIREGKVIPRIGAYTNAHNEYVDALVKHGIIGLLAQLALYLVPLALFARQLRDPRGAVHPFALAGVSLYTCYFIFGLTTTFLTLNIGVMMLAFLTVILWAALRQQQRAAAPDSR